MTDYRATPLPACDSQSEDDIDDLFKKELNRMTSQGEGAEVFGGSSTAFGVARSTSFPGPQTSTVLEMDRNEPEQSSGSSNASVVSFGFVELYWNASELRSDGDAVFNSNHVNGDNTNKQRPTTSSNPPQSSFFGTLRETYRWTRQVLAEGLGNRSKSVDPVLHAQIVALWATRREYRNIGKTVSTLATNFEQFMHSQRELAGAFRLMSVQEANLVDEFVYNADMQDILYKNGCALLAAMKAFASAIETLCNQTMVDTLWTAKQLNYARIQHDAIKSELTALQSSVDAKYCELERKYLQQKRTYEGLKENLKVKLKLLNDNKVSVMHRQLESFHNAVSAYFSGNQADLETSMKHFQTHPGVASSSWLEQKN